MCYNRVSTWARLDSKSKEEHEKHLTAVLEKLKEHYEVEAILDTRLNRTKAGKLLREEFLVRWKGYGPKHNITHGNRKATYSTSRT